MPRTASSIAIVAANPEDADLIRAFMADVISSSVSADPAVLADTIHNVDGNVATWLAHPERCLHLKAMSEQGLVGIVLVKDFWNLCSLFVAPARHRQGIGQLLVESAMHQCRGRSPKRALFLNAAPDAISFYRRLGFSDRQSTQQLPAGFLAMQLAI